MKATTAELQNLSNQGNYQVIEKMIESFVYTYDNEIVDASFLKFLLDQNGNQTFGLFSLDTGGYAVVVFENQMISELLVHANNTSFLESAVYYLGPGTFFSNEEFTFYENNQLPYTAGIAVYNQLLSTSPIDKILAEENPNFIYSESPYQLRMNPIIAKPSVIVGGTEIGIIDSRMTEYKKEEWHNDNDVGKDYLYLGQGICGTIATSIALSYIDKYVNSNVIVNAPYVFPSFNYANWLIMKLKYVIEPPVPGSFASDIINGISWFYGTTNSNISGTTLAPISSISETTYKSNIQTGYPVIMYLDIYSQDITPYGLHWVTAYRYVDYNGALWFKAADTWGNLAWINRNWIGQVVYFLH